MKKLQRTKLKLAKQTLRLLDADKLGLVAGGTEEQKTDGGITGSNHYNCTQRLCDVEAFDTSSER